VKLLESLQRTILTKIANELPFAKCQYDVWWENIRTYV
jgi:hypothetical protein